MELHAPLSGSQPRLPGTPNKVADDLLDFDRFSLLQVTIHRRSL